MKILLVDDQENMQKYAGKILSDLGYKNITFADNGVHAIEIISAQKETSHFDLIISDFNMPKMTGLELLKEIRSNSNENINSVIFLCATAETDTDMIIDILNAGGNGYIIKPYDKEALQEKINEVINKE